MQDRLVQTFTHNGKETHYAAYTHLLSSIYKWHILHHFTLTGNETFVWCWMLIKLQIWGDTTSLQEIINDFLFSFWVFFFHHIAPPPQAVCTSSISPCGALHDNHIQSVCTEYTLFGPFYTWRHYIWKMCLESAWTNENRHSTDKNKGNRWGVRHLQAGTDI